MNSYDRLIARLAGRPVDRAPNLSILMRFAAEYAGVSYRDFCLDSATQAAAGLKCHRELGIDAVTVMSDPYGEADDYGMKIEYPENATPRVLHLLWPEDGPMPNAGDIPPRGLEDAPRMRGRIETIARYVEAVKGECPIVGWVEGPVAEYCNLRDTSATMMDFAEEAEFLPPVLDTLCAQAIVYARAQIEAGADIIGIGDAACSMLGPALYQKYGKPYEKRLIDAVHMAGGKVKLHICGNTTTLLPDIAELQPDIFDVDWMVDLAQAARSLPNTSTSGNMDPVAVMLQGTPRDVAAATKACLAAGNNRSIIAAGCEIPPGTPVENLLAIVAAL